WSMPVAARLQRAHGDRAVSTADRSWMWQAQTPQMSRHAILMAALHRDLATAFTDEAQAVEALAATGGCAPPRLVHGSATNVKITYAEDLALAAALLAMQP